MPIHEHMWGRSKIITEFYMPVSIWFRNYNAMVLLGRNHISITRQYHFAHISVKHCFIITFPFCEMYILYWKQIWMWKKQIIILNQYSNTEEFQSSGKICKLMFWFFVLFPHIHKICYCISLHSWATEIVYLLFHILSPNETLMPSIIWSHSTLLIYIASLFNQVTN